MTTQSDPVATVVSLTRFPFKSMRGEAVEETGLGWHGLHGDRRFAFVRRNNKTGFPWLTAREYPALSAYASRLKNPENAKNSPVMVLAPDGTDYEADSGDLLERVQAEAGEPIDRLQNWSGVFDTADVSVISRQSINSLFPDGAVPDERRFRSNVVLDAPTEGAFPEDKWVGRVLLFGDRSDSARMHLIRRDIRCNVVNVNPDSGARDADVLSRIVKERKNQLGVYALAFRPGSIKVGDRVYLAR